VIFRESREVFRLNEAVKVVRLHTRRLIVKDHIGINSGVGSKPLVNLWATVTTATGRPPNDGWVAPPRPL
jgi:hypothetical protein